MANQQPNTLSAWLRGLPIPWLVSNPVGAADATAQGTLYDGQVSLAKQAVLARFPDYAPSDALPYIGKDRKLIQGYAESDANFRVRLRTAWDQWALAGTWAELLFQLYWSCGFDTASTWIVQQNGYAYSLSADPSPTTDPTTLLTITPLMDAGYPVHSPPVPWWYFDNRLDLCSRFAIVIGVPGVLPGTFQITARATFDGTSDRETAVWSGPFDNAGYSYTVGVPVTTDGSAPIVSADATSATGTTIAINASAAFTGYVDLLGWSGADPFISPSQQTLNVLRSVVTTWKPAKATYMGLYAAAAGPIWGWPLTSTWGAAGVTWGQNVYEFYGP